MFNKFIDFVNTKKRAPVVSSVSSAPAALGAPPPDDSFTSQPFPIPGVEGSASSAPNFRPDLGLDRGLVGPSLTVNQNVMGRSGLYAYSRALRLRVKRYRSTRLDCLIKQDLLTVILSA